MFSWPFMTTDNLLHLSCQDLIDFNNISDGKVIDDAMYGGNTILLSIIIDKDSVESLCPGNDMNSNIMSFCLSW